MKKKLFFKFFVFAVIAAFVTVTSCKDYDDDINRLDDKIAEINKTLGELKAKVDAGAVISKVESVSGGVKVTLSDGKDFTLTNGENGAAGKNGSVVEIGTNGNWFIDGKDTGKPSKGDAGKDGVTGPQGPQGPAGKDGVYFTPDESGYWYKVEVVNGKEVSTKTDQTWLPTGTITAVWENGAVTLHNVEGIEGPVTIGLVAVTNLTLIADFVGDEGGALPLLNFSPLKTPCGEIAPSALAKYRVSPKNASLSSIDKDKLYFEYNSPTVLKSSKINPKAEFVGFDSKTGILTVRVSIDTDELYAQKDNKIDQLMLVAPLTTGGDAHSDWAKVVSNPINELALVRIPDLVDKTTDWKKLELAKTAEAAKALAKTDLTIVDLAYDETLALEEVVKTMVKNNPWADFLIDTYNLEYAFDLNDEKGKKITYELGNNKTDQQKFLNLIGSKISTRVYDLEGANPAAIDRTPIVHVYLKSKDGAVKCNVLDGFIKINIVEAKVTPVPPVEIPVPGNVEAGCEDFKLTVETQQMNEEFYAAAKVSKTFFHQNYKWAEEVSEEPLKNVGTIVEKQDPKDTDSYNLIWTVTPDELAANIGKEISKSGTYTYGPNVIKVTFKAKVTQPQINLSGLMLENYWDASKSFIVHNVAVPDKGAKDPNLATFDTNINNAFKTNSKALLDLVSLGDKYKNYTYEYFFDAAKEQPVKAYNGISVSVSKDGKELIATKGSIKETIATIKAQADKTGDVLSYNSQSALGKELLNAGVDYMKARLYIAVKNECGKEVAVKGFKSDKAFDVHFLRPVNVGSKAADNFIDGVDFGAKGSYIDIKKVVQLSDWRNEAKGVDTYNFEPNNSNYYDFYAVKSIKVDKDNIKPIGLKVDGKDLTQLPATILIDQTADNDSYEGNIYKFGRLTYRNNGASLISPFTLEVPVTVEYKWGKVTTKVKVDVKPTNATRSASK